MVGRPFASVDKAQSSDYCLPILSKPVAPNVKLLTNYEAAKELLQAGVLRWRDGVLATYIAPIWVELG